LNDMLDLMLAAVRRYGAAGALYRSPRESQ
jgi:hypothetical protein